MAWRAAVKIAYDGRDFMGSQRQPDELTVEGELLRSLNKIGAIASANESVFRMASRTDRGVSALGNVVSFITDFKKSELLGAMNASSETVHSYALAEVPLDFNPRRASARWYRYFLSADEMDMEKAEECAAMFVGEHDFCRFCKVDDRKTVKKIDEIRVMPLGHFLVIDIRAREFLRNMVRRVVAAIREVAGGRASLEQVDLALKGRDRSFGLAPPENLILMDVDYGFKFDVQCAPTLNRKLTRYEEDAFLRLALIDSLSDRCRT